MFYSPYQTTICKHYRLDELNKQLSELIVSGQTTVVNGIHYVTKVSPDVKPFTHPIVLNIPSRPNEHYIVVDSRGITSINENTGAFRYTPDFEYQTTRAVLTKRVWLDGNVSDLLNCGDIQIKIFSAMIADTMGRRLNLEPNVVDNVRMVAAYYFICLHDSARSTDEDTLLKDAKRISRNIGIQIEEVYEFIKTVGVMSTAESLCRGLALNSDSRRLESMTPAVLFTMLGGLWFGQNAVEQVSVALEHPPTYAAMLHMVINDRSYRKTVLVGLLDRYDRKRELSEVFNKNIRNILRG